VLHHLSSDCNDSLDIVVVSLPLYLAEMWDPVHMRLKRRQETILSSQLKAKHPGFRCHLPSVCLSCQIRKQWLLGMGVSEQETLSLDNPKLIKLSDPQGVQHSGPRVATSVVTLYLREYLCWAGL
jgi:hypothetical protein